MPKTLDKPTSLGLLDRLDQKDLRRKISGAGAHQYKLNPPLLISVIEAFEKQQGGSLPGDYRSFITEFRNGGADPFYGLSSFGMQDDGFDLCSWEGGRLIGDLSKPFPHVAAWKLPRSCWNGEQTQTRTCLWKRKTGSGKPGTHCPHGTLYLPPAPAA